MPNELPLPPDLQHLIEKRGKTDRRQHQPCRDQDSEEDAATCGDAEGESEAFEEVPESERQAQPNRRKKKRRRNGC